MNDPMPTGAALLEEPFAVDTPENVTFGHAVAGIGSRYVGALIDSAILLALLVAVNLVLVTVLSYFPNAIDAARSVVPNAPSEYVSGVIMAVFLLIQFIIFWGYYVLFELLWQGQTPGKRLAGVRVLRDDGGPAGGAAVVVRNLVRVIDFLPFAYGVGFIVMLLNRQARRLGDYAAGTLAVYEGERVDLGHVRQLAHPSADLLSPTEAARAAAVRRRMPHVDRLAEADAQLIADALADDRRHRLDPALLARLARAIAVKLEVTPPGESQARQFLTDVALAYRSLQ
jgi:uncharacterized RDD family membrane protein YckC